jgi:Ser/Thr protein kinase RdoA (MazF antagonist)
LDYTLIDQGLINRTYRVHTDAGNYIIQSINHQIFTNPWDIDYNINAIGNYLQNHSPDYLFTHLVKATNGASLIEWEGNYYRAFNKIEGYALSVLENAQQAKEAAAQFGYFTQILSDFPITNLKITLPDFHNLSLRYHQFSTALLRGNQTRIMNCREAILFLQAHRWIVDCYESFIQNPETQLRVTHHDTKISNVLFQKIAQSEKAICVIDLDTVMPGYFISDLGDMCRTCLCAVSEEEADLNLVQIDASKWDALQQGYLTHTQSMLTPFEIDHLFFGGQYMIYMQALRFLTDYLNNDSYYGAKYEGQNLVRALNQIRLLETYNKLK